MGGPVNIVRVSRVRGLEPIEGHIFRSNADLVLLAEVSDSLDLDGICLIPTRTVRAFDRDFDRVRFYNAAVGEIALSAEIFRLLDLLDSDLLGGLRVLNQHGATIAIHCELDDPDVCFVGTAHGLDSQSLRLVQISSFGEVLDGSVSIQLQDITKVEVATRYLQAVGRAAAVLGKE